MPVIMKSIYKPEEFESIPVSDIDRIITAIQTGDEWNLKELTAQIRVETDPKKKKALKLRLPCVNLGDFGKRKVINKNFERAWHLIYDIDHIPADKMDECKEILKKYAYFYYVSPSGNGLKFAIRINDNTDRDFISPVTNEVKFRETYRNYIAFFSHELNIDNTAKKRYYELGGKDSGMVEPMDVDTKCEDPRRSPFMCYDPNCYFNPESHIFPTFKPFILTEATVRSYLARPDADQLKQICLYLSHLETPLSYDEWVRVGMALCNEPDGFLYWKSIPPSESYRHYNEDQLRRKFNSFNNGSVTIATLYYIAIQHGYNIVAGGADNRYPFLSVIGKDLAKKGLFQPMVDVGFDFQESNQSFNWVIKSGKNLESAFNWECLLPEGVTETWDGREMKIWNIDGEFIPIPNESLSNIQAFKTYLMKKSKKAQWVKQTSEPAYNRLFEYLAKAKAKKVFYEIKEIGHIADNVWNLGNICIINGNIVPIDEIISIEGKFYMLEKTDHLYVNIDPDNMVRAFNELIPYYPDLPLIMGWVTAQLFTRDLIKENIKLPLLFMHGQSGSGKSTLAELIFLLHGIDKSAMDEFKISMASKSTAAGRDRLRQIMNSVPLHIDEYKDQYWDEFKAMYDRSSSIKSRFKTELGTYRLEVKCGTLISAVNPPVRNETEELINRCMYIETTTKTHGRDLTGDFFDMIYRNKKYFSNYIAEVILNYKFDEFLDNYLRLRDDSFLAQLPERVSRIDNNFRLCMAGWEFAKRYFPKWEEKPHYWRNKYNDLIKWCKGKNTAYKFARVICRLYHHPQYKDRFTAKDARTFFEDEEYRFVAFVFNYDLWQIALEVDGRGERILQGLTVNQVEQSFRHEFPKQLKILNMKNGRWNIALKAKELDSAYDAMNAGKDYL